MYRGQYFLSIFYESRFKDKYMSYFITWVFTNDRFVIIKKSFESQMIYIEEENTLEKKKKIVVFFWNGLGGGSRLCLND